MFQVLTLNKISKTGLSHFDPAFFTCADDLSSPDAVIVRSASMHEMELPENLLAIARAGAGTNNIPIDRCTEQGVAVFNTPGANANAVKELVICALFLTSRKIVEGARWVEGLKGEGENVSAKVEKGKGQFVGPEILGKTLGVIGLGAIGLLVAESAKALGMRVVAYDPFFNRERLPQNVELYDTLDEVFPLCDYLTLHLPLNDATRGLVGKDSIARMKDGVRILNFARGPLVDDESIIAALDEGKVSAYATDFPTDAQLCHPGVIAIPHLGASTPESEENCAVMAVEELSEYLLSGNVHNSVNLPELRLERQGKARISVITRGECAASIGAALAGAGVNVTASASAVKKGVSCCLFDTDDEVTDDVIEKIKSDSVIAIRII
ncbi:MAG: 3-phosphoglycerate dehydrogenase [Clostridia bacterium]|nr:3-phosphoglycerate dehydrogenase [Clostridia bacterium]